MILYVYIDNMIPFGVKNVVLINGMHDFGMMCAAFSILS
jgi:hypothetical protein